ncbi:MAG: pectinesterase family protein [Saprospiraceae bacterium]
MIVAGDAIITFIVDTYGVAADAIFELTDSDGTVLGTMPAQNLGGADGFPVSYSYMGNKGAVTATIVSNDFPTAEIYIHGMVVENAAQIAPGNGKTDVWDFGAMALDTADYNNLLDEATINAWYDPSITVGSSGNVLPSSWSAGQLSWVGGGNDRLRTTNVNLTRYDENIASVTDYTGRIYVNSAANAGRFLSLTLREDDELTLVTKTDAGGKINFEYVNDPDYQTDAVVITSDLQELNFVAKSYGTYHIYDTQGKPSYFRILRKDATYLDLTGAVDESGANGIPANYSIVFTNDAGKTWSSTVSNGTYIARLPIGYHYELSLADANGYVISTGGSIDIDENTTTHDIAVVKVELYTVSGNITGLGTQIDNLALVYTADPASGAIYVPAATVDAGASTYTVELEPNVEYTISANGVNDYFIPNDKITITAATNADVDFMAKQVYNITIDAQGLSGNQVDDLELTFSNLNEPGYEYTFASVNGIALRDGVYGIGYGGMDAYPVELALTSNLKVEQADATKSLKFVPVTNWDFDDKAIANGDPAYKGLLFTGQIANEANKGHLTGKDGATIQVPVNPGESMRVTYYYTADFSVDGGATFSTNSQSTSLLEMAEFAYAGATPGYMTITVGASVGTSYFPNINVYTPVPYKAELKVGVDKDFQTVNGALTAVRNMSRPNDERVVIEIDPGNYEEMLVIDVPNVTLKNAAMAPSINLDNQGVDISPNAVRITSYYGHGYSYYSMANNQKYDAEVLQVNKENGYLSYENKGAGTTNGSWWNATVVVTANGFEADHIIFENSFNQYISQKEADDVVIEWVSGGKGTRPTTVGAVDVQNRSFVERAAAMAIANNTDKVVLNKCRIIGRQDSFFGGVGCRVVVYKGSVMGAVDYIFGAMTAVFYKTDLDMNVSDVAGDASYLTAAQQGSGRGYLMYECNVSSAIPGIESASTYRAKPGYFGRPWQATTSEVVFFNTNIETSDFPGSEGKSLIAPLGWQNTLGGESSMMYEYGTVEESGEDNGGSRASWSTLLRHSGIERRNGHHHLQFHQRKRWLGSTSKLD